MKRWRIWVLLALLLCIPILAGRSSSPALLQDSDTAFLLQTIRQKQAPMSWFVGDWPLANHFYRPLPTLTFELDTRLYGDNPAGYGLTTAILIALGVLSLFWMLGEMSSSPIWAFAGAGLFALWNYGFGSFPPETVLWPTGAVILLGFYRHGLKAGRYIPAALVIFFLAMELTAPEAAATPVSSRMIYWLPGRTASVMTLFALVAAAAYLRYERARATRSLPTPTAFDRPTATRTGTSATPKHPGIWLAISYLSAACAFASYEQAVMLPAILLGLAIYLRCTGWKPNWRIHAGFWVMLGAYLAMRHFILPASISRYQSQQLRYGPGVYQDLLAYLLPNTFPLYAMWMGLKDNVYMLLTPSLWSPLLNFVATATTYGQARRHWQIIVAGLLMSTLAYLPMAWLKQFGHYHYWPLALRTIFILGIGRLAWDLASIAVCPPAIQAPPRPSPAPGSLPHP